MRSFQNISLTALTLRVSKAERAERSGLPRFFFGYFLCSNDKEMPQHSMWLKNNNKYHIKVTIKLYGGSNTLAQVGRPAPVINNIPRTAMLLSFNLFVKEINNKNSE